MPKSSETVPFEPATSAVLSTASAVTYAGILDEHLLENTVMLDTLTLERLTKALENASKSVKDARPLTRYASLI